MLFFSAQNTLTCVSARHPQHSDPIFYSIEELIDWIEMEDADLYQDGRFRESLLSIRNQGELFIPFFDDPNVTLVYIEVVGAHRQGDFMTLHAIYSTPSSQIVVRIRSMNPLHVDVYESEGISGYFATTRIERADNFQTLERAITTKDIATGDVFEHIISYAFVDALDSVTFPVAFTVFIVNGFELGVTYHNVASGMFFNDIIWGISPISYRPETRTAHYQAYEVYVSHLVPHTTNTIRFTIGSTNYTINNTPHTTDVAPFLDTVLNRTMIPLRAVAVALGAEVDWFPTTRTVHVYTANGVHRLNVGTPLPEGMGIPIMYQSRVFVPIRYVADILDAETRWDRDNLAVYIYQHVTPN